MTQGYSKYEIGVTGTSFTELLNEISQQGDVVVVGMRLEYHPLSIEAFSDAVSDIGDHKFYQEYPTFLMIVQDLTAFLAHWDLIREFFESTFVLILKDVQSLNLDLLYSQHFDIRNPDSLLTIAIRVWRKVQRRAEQLARMPIIVIADSSDDWGLVAVYQEGIDSTSWKRISRFLDKELLSPWRSRRWCHSPDRHPGEVAVGADPFLEHRPAYTTGGKVKQGTGTGQWGICCWEEKCDQPFGMPRPTGGSSPSSRGGDASAFPGDQV